MTLSPNIVLGNDYVTAYFADQIWPKTLKDHRKRWDDAAKTGEPTPRSRLTGLSAAYFRTKPDAVDGDTDALAALNGQVTEALGYPVDLDLLGQPDPTIVTLSRGDDLFDLPCLAAVTDGDDHPRLVAIAADTFTADPSLLITSDAKPRHRLHRHGHPDAATDGTDTVPGLVNEIFAVEHPPRWVLVVAGGAVALLDHKPWIDGKWLGANVDDILSNGDRTSGGELDQLAGWFSTAGTIPNEDGTSLLDAAVDGSQRQAVGVSESLRDAVRAGVEAIANEVLYDRRERRKLSVFGEQGGVTVDAADLARQSIRWMYRLVVLLYAEARPGIGILPTTQDGTTLYDRYEAGYGLERLRQLALVELDSEAARNGTHIHQSLNLLFRLVNEGHQRPAAAEISADGADTWTGIEFTPLNSRLFGPRSCPDIDAAHLRDHVLQKVIAGLCFTPGEKGKGRQAVSYANLEINQLGAVYEGLMAYTGFIALEDRNEVAARGKGDSKDGVARSADPSRGSWTIPTTEAHRYPDNVFVTEIDPDTGETRPIVHEKGSFVFRLAGRDRARSASFYTPSVLTEFTVRHALEEWQANHPDLTAADVLQMTILEPALGSGAFANEACDQAAELYLRLREGETGETVPAEDRPTELRKLRAHFAINQTYGVDLNDTAVELAEVSLWLNSMHPGLSAPPLSHRLRRGNSLIGCTRSTYTEDQVAKQPWRGDVFPPTDKPLSEHPLGTQGLGIHHFLLPGEGWGAAAKTGKGNPCRELAPEWCEKVWDWRKEIHKKPSKAQITRAKALANKVESLWAAAAVDVTSHLNAQNRRIAIWNDPGTILPTGDSTRFRDPNGPYQRLKTIMDAWCALWMWAPEHRTALPTLDQWFDCIEYLCGEKRADAEGRLFGEHTHIVPPSAKDSGLLFETETTFDDVTSVGEAVERWPWLAHCGRIRDRQAFFHWDLEFLSVLHGGITVGNPPWVQPKWEEPAVLAEDDPWWGLVDLKAIVRDELSKRRQTLLELPAPKERLLAEGAESLGLNEILSSPSREPLLGGLKTNLYLNFLTFTLRMARLGSTAALIHPDNHFRYPAAASLRSRIYPLLRRHWHFENELRLFDIGNSREFAVHVYSDERDRGSIRFVQAVNLLHPSTLDRSYGADGDALPPGLKTAEGAWDQRPHPDRIMEIDESDLSVWAALFDGADADYRSARLMKPLTGAVASVLRTLSKQETSVSQLDFRWAIGFDEGKVKRDRDAVWRTERPTTLDQAILQGPHLLNSSPMAQEAKAVWRSNKDYVGVDPDALVSADFVPRTNYQFLQDRSAVLARSEQWDQKSYAEYYRCAHREFVESGSVRTLQACLLPPGPAHVSKVNSIAFRSNADTSRWAGLLSSLPYDFLIKTMGVSGINKNIVMGLPVPKRCDELENELLIRTLRLNCVHPSFADLWDELATTVLASPVKWAVPEIGTVELALVPAEWSPAVPLRAPLDRWLAQCEIDSLAALLLGMRESELVAVYRAQFGVLRTYERATFFGSNGWSVCGEYHGQDVRQRVHDQGDGERLWDLLLAAESEGGPAGHVAPPFRRADRELAMRTAYRAFAERSGKTDGVSADPLPEWEVWG